MVLDGCPLKVCELADMVGVSKSAVHRILTENLEMRKLCARWMPHLLTMKQKQRRGNVLIECLAIFHSIRATPETKEESQQWIKKKAVASPVK